MTKNRVYLYDSTLRDGAQARGVDFTLADKIAIATELDKLGIDYIEGGWPGANPNDDQFFAAAPKLARAKLSAFGMTRRSGRSAENDPALMALLEAETSNVCLVGKTWDFQVEKALGVSRKENLRMIEESIALMVKRKKETHFDAEHFFDGYKANPEFALECLQTAAAGGARWIVLCDTNGGSLPHEVGEIVAEVTKHIKGEHLGIHCHNDTEQAVANSIAAVRAGVRQVQGTINGVGERCGNANLMSIIPTLMLKMGMNTGIAESKLPQLTHVSRVLDERLNRPSNPHAAYVGAAAFAHKGGLHVSAMAKDSRTYEHIDPALVGNNRVILVSDKSGRANIVARLEQFGIGNAAENEHIADLVRVVKEREVLGYAYEEADASFELLARETLGLLPEFFEVTSFRALDEQRWNARGKRITLAEATVKIKVQGEEVMTVAEGNGPVNALDSALRKALLTHFPEVASLALVDYKVRILTPKDATGALTRVRIESRDETGQTWNTIGVSTNIIDASFNALYDAITYHLLRQKMAKKSRTKKGA